MAYANSWVVKSETSGKLYGPFSSAHVAGKWATKHVSNYVLIRLRSS